MTEQAGRWVRVSTAGQDERNQEPDIDRWCADHGYEAVKTYRLHGKSASKGKQQAALDEVLADMRAGRVQVLVVWHSSRIERRGAWNALDLALKVREAGGRIEYVQDAYLNETNDMSDVMLALAASQNKKYSDNISKQVTAAFQRIDSNKAVRGRAGYGYRVVGETKYEKRIVPESVEAAVIREAKERYLDGETIDAICADFNARGIASPTFKRRPGTHWYAKTLAGLLRSPSIAGRRYPRDEHNLPDETKPVIATYEPILTWDEHKRLVARLDSRAHRKGISPGNVALLTSVLYDDDGHPMYRLNQIYYCRKCKAAVNLARADAEIGELFEHSTTPYLVPQLVPGENHADEIARLRQDRSELDDLADDYDERHASITAEIRRLDRLDREHPNPDHTEWVESGKTYGEVWQESSTAERRDDMLAAGFRVIWHGDGKWSIQPGTMVLGIGDTELNVSK